MREFLTVLATLLVLALAAALVGPQFVDWSAQRGVFEARLGEALGRPVSLAGPIDLRLLPSPRLRLGAFALADAPGQPAFSGRSLQVELAAMPLLSGELRFVEAILDHPELRLTLQDDGGVKLPDLAIGGRRAVRFERVTLTQATIVAQDPSGREVLRFSDLDLTAEANSLDGPFKGAGRVASGQGPLAFRFATGAAEGGKLRLKASIDPVRNFPRSEIDGTLSMAATPEGRRQAVFDGAALLSGRIEPEETSAGRPVPWRLSGTFHADSGKADASALELRLGTDETSFVAVGTGSMQFGPQPLARLALSARQIDLDKLEALQAIAAGWLAHPAPGAHLPFAAEAELAAPLVNFGGQSLTDATLGLSLAPGRAAGLRLSGAGPGRSSLAMAGEVETGPGLGFKGRMQLAAQDSPRLADWVATFAPQTAGLLRALPFRSFEASGEAQVSAISLSVSDLDLKLDRSAFSGAVAYSKAVWTEKARLFADLSAKALDLDAVPDLSGALADVGDTDLALTLEARAIKVAHVGDGAIDAGRIAFKLVKTGPQIALEQFSLVNLGGADVTASGRWSGAAGHLDARIDAARLGDAAELLRRVLPGPAAELLVRRAAALSPARVNLAADALVPAGGTAVMPGAVTLDGNAGATKLLAQWRPDAADPARGAGTLALDAPGAALLLRQLGFEVPPQAGGGRGKIDAILRGRIEGPFEGQIDATLAGVQLGWRGTLAPPAANGALKIDSANIAPLAAMLGAALPEGEAGLALRAEAKLDAKPEGLGLTALAGQAGGSRFEGALAFAEGDGSGARLRASGALKLDRLPAGALFAMALGAQASAKPGALWPDQKLSRGLGLAALADVALEIGSFDLWPEVPPQPATMRLQLGPGLVALRDLALKLAGGHAEGELVLRRDGAEASLRGRIGFSGLAVLTPGLTGVASGQIDVTGTGQSANTLVAGLAGTGQLRLAQGQVPHANPDAIRNVLAQADNGGFAVDDSAVRRALENALDRKPLLLGDQSFDLALAAGTLRLAAPGGALRVALDLRNLMVDERLSLRESIAPKEWTGELPQVELVLKGPVGGPQREVEASSFAQGLASREIARDNARIVALEADIRERAAFNRRLKAIKQTRENEIALQKFLDDEARRAAEEAKRLAEEEARRKVEEAKRAAEEARRAAEEEARRRVEEFKRAAEEAKKAADDAKKAAEDARRAAEAEKRRLEEVRRAEEKAREEVLRKRIPGAPGAEEVPGVQPFSFKLPQGQQPSPPAAP